MFWPFKISEKTHMFVYKEVTEVQMQDPSEINTLFLNEDCGCTCNCGVITVWTVCVSVRAGVECLRDSLFIDEKRHHKEHLEEAADGADLDGVHSLDGFHQESND